MDAAGTLCFYFINVFILGTLLSFSKIWYFFKSINFCVNFDTNLMKKLYLLKLCNKILLDRLNGMVSSYCVLWFKPSLCEKENESKNGQSKQFQIRQIICFLLWKPLLLKLIKFRISSSWNRRRTSIRSSMGAWSCFH